MITYGVNADVPVMTASGEVFNRCWVHRYLVGVDTERD